MPARGLRRGMKTCFSWRAAWAALAPNWRSRSWPAPRRWRPRASRIISLSIGQPDFQTPGHIVEAAIKALKDGHHGYTPANGIPQVREAVAADLQRRHGVKVDPANRAGRAGRQGDDVLCHADVRRTGRGDHLSEPGFPDLRVRDQVHRRDRGAAAAAGGERLRLQGRGLARPRSRRSTRLIILNSPANPTGGDGDQARKCRSWWPASPGIRTSR